MSTCITNVSLAAADMFSIAQHELTSQYTQTHTTPAQSIGARAPRPGHPETIDGTHAHAFEKIGTPLNTGEVPRRIAGPVSRGPAFRPSEVEVHEVGQRSGRRARVSPARSAPASGAPLAAVGVVASRERPASAPRVLLSGHSLSGSSAPAWFFTGQAVEAQHAPGDRALDRLSLPLL